MSVELKLKQGGIADFRFEARQIMTLPKEKREQAVKRRLSGEPLQYILGEWEFYGLPFLVGEGVLIPRPDTETLIDAVLPLINKDSAVLDLCSGSGAVAVTLKKLKGASVTALEKSPDAVKYLIKNARLNKTDIKIIEGDIFDFSPPQKYDLIVSNPPYIKTEDIKTLQIEVQKEPLMALDGGTDGLMFYRKIAQFVPCLKKDGAMAVEIGYDMAKEVAGIFEKAGLRCKILKDLPGNDRVVIGTLL